jgi:hypothetical protein
MAGHMTEWTIHDHPLPFLKHLYALPGIHPPDLNAHNGYALTRAVHARFLPLVQFLLEGGAIPQCKNSLAVIVAIRQKDLALLRVLVERDGSVRVGSGEGGKRKKIEDRVRVDAKMLRAAVRYDARDIVQYLIDKGCVPDMQTLHMMVQ